MPSVGNGLASHRAPDWQLLAIYKPDRIDWTLKDF